MQKKSYLTRGESTEVLALAADVTSDAFEGNSFDRRELGGIYTSEARGFTRRFARKWCCL